MNPLERPETWDLSRFSDMHGAPAVTYPPADARRVGPAKGVESGKAEADKSRHR